MQMLVVSGSYQNDQHGAVTNNQLICDGEGALHFVHAIQLFCLKLLFLKEFS
jgi:hypothetical protein